MSRIILYRIGIDSIVLLSTLLIPWWVVLIIFLCMNVLFSSWYEGVLFGFVLDVLFNAPQHVSGGFQFIMTTSAILLLLLVWYVRGLIR